MIPLSEFCGGRIETIEEDAGVREAARQMREHGVGSLLVVDRDGRLKGVLTDRDLALRVIATRLDPGATPVRNVMSEPAVSVSKDDSLQNTITTMRNRGVRRVPICEDGKPVGICALDDVLEVLTEALHHLSVESSTKRRRSIRRARLLHAREEIDEMLEEVHDRMAYAQWYAREALLDEVDQVKEAFRRALKRFD